MLIGINVALFLVELVLGAVGFMGGGNTQVLVDLGALVPAYVAVKHEYWRLFTAMFLHGGLLHIAFNMYALYLGGSFLEALAGKGKYLAIYLVAGLAGNVAVYLLASPFSVTIGASTAIFGVFGALFVYSLHNRDSAAGRALRSMGTVILINLVITFLIPGISWQGHIGGLVGGVARRRGAHVVRAARPARPVGRARRRPARRRGRRPGRRRPVAHHDVPGDVSRSADRLPSRRPSTPPVTQLPRRRPAGRTLSHAGARRETARPRGGAPGRCSPPPASTRR